MFRHWLQSNKAFGSTEDGAVTVDWVVITAAIAGMAIGLILIITDGATTYAKFINEDIVDIARKAGSGG